MTLFTAGLNISKTVKTDIAYRITHNYAIIKGGSYDYLPLEKIINVIIFVKSVWNKDQNNFYYNIFLEKAPYELPKKKVFVLMI